MICFVFRFKRHGSALKYLLFPEVDTRGLTFYSRNSVLLSSLLEYMFQRLKETERICLREMHAAFERICEKGNILFGICFEKFLKRREYPHRINC